MNDVLNIWKSSVYFVFFRHWNLLSWKKLSYQKYPEDGAEGSSI